MVCFGVKAKVSIPTQAKFLDVHPDVTSQCTLRVRPNTICLSHCTYIYASIRPPIERASQTSTLDPALCTYNTLQHIIRVRVNHIIQIQGSRASGVSRVCVRIVCGIWDASYGIRGARRRGQSRVESWSDRGTPKRARRGAKYGCRSVRRLHGRENEAGCVGREASFPLCARRAHDNSVHVGQMLRARSADDAPAAPTRAALFVARARAKPPAFFRCVFRRRGHRAHREVHDCRLRRRRGRVGLRDWERPLYMGCK